MHLLLWMWFSSIQFRESGVPVQMGFSHSFFLFYLFASSMRSHRLLSTIHSSSDRRLRFFFSVVFSCWNACSVLVTAWAYMLDADAHFFFSASTLCTFLRVWFFDLKFHINVSVALLILGHWNLHAVKNSTEPARPQSAKMKTKTVKKKSACHLFELRTACKQYY